MAKKKSRITTTLRAESKKQSVADAAADVADADADASMKDVDVSDQKKTDDHDDDDDAKVNSIPEEQTPAVTTDNKRKRAAAPSTTAATITAATTVASAKPRATRSRKEVASLDANTVGDSKPVAVDEKPKTATATSKPRATRNRTSAVSTAAASKKAPSVPKKAATIQKDDDEQQQQADAEHANDANVVKAKATKKRGTASVIQSITTRDEIPKLWNAHEARRAHGSYTFKIASWNVAGLRAVLRNSPNALADLLKNHDLDVLCLQETKLQESHLEDPQFVEFREQLLEQGYHIYYSCSVERKGYSGTAVIVRRGNNPAAIVTASVSEQPDDKKKTKKQTNLKNFFGAKKTEAAEAPTKETDAVVNGDPPKLDLPEDLEHLFDSTKVSYGIGQTEHDGEGRVIVMDFPFFSLCNVYTPNSGQDLIRLSYRVEQWDKDFLSFIQSHSKERQLPILWLGDLNIAHRALDVYNDGAKHLAKQAGLTPQERASFTQQLEDSGFVDVFRHLHPTAQGHYTYWSTRAGNRDANKGLRLDYFVCDPVMLAEEKSNVIVRDSYMLPEIKGSDHCPIVLEMEIKPTDKKVAK